MFHCELQYSEILLAQLMVTADVFKTHSYEMPRLLFGFLGWPKMTVLSAVLVWSSVWWRYVDLAVASFVLKPLLLNSW